VSDVLFLVLRRLRAPLVILIAVYAISVLGLALMPGVDPDGRPWRMGFFYAFYVMSYTATTIGFGELPYPFSDAQRAWLMVSIYLSVIGWAYALGMIFALTGDPTFRRTVAHAMFRWRVRGLGEPFFVICGCGQSGTALAAALDSMGYRLVLIDVRQERAAQAALGEFSSPVLVLEADARLPEILSDAGIVRSDCRGLIALTGSDAANQSIAIGARVLNREIQVIARVKDPVAQGNLEAFGSVFTINPFKAFATNLSLDIAAPEVLRLEDWLTDPPGAPCPARINVPKGKWVLLGFGRFGQLISEVLDDYGIGWTAIDPSQSHTRDARVLAADNSEDALRAAGVPAARVVVAGTDNDSVNLGVITLAKRLNPKLFTIMRQNTAADRVLIDSARPNVRYVQAEIVVRESLQVLKDPLLNRFVLQIRDLGGAHASRVIEALLRRLGNAAPRFWEFHCDTLQPGMFDAFLRHPERPPRLEHLLQDPDVPERTLAAVALMVVTRTDTVVQPGNDYRIRPGDRILFAGRRRARSQQMRYLYEPNLFESVRTGEPLPRALVFRWLADQRQRRIRGARA
jgi:Trk K+ transport system NAD-binding subunit